jgi:DNA topoisomerase-3
LAPPEVKSAELTAKWEQQLSEISKGRAGSGNFINKIRSYAAQLVKTVVNSDQTFRHDNLTRVKCPDCGKFLLQVKGKRGEMYLCQDRECGYRKGISQTSNVRCPQCHKRMEIRGEGEGRLFVCACGYREKLSVFTKRRESEKDKANKWEVRQFLREQKVNEPINTALADALAKLKKE